MDHRPGDSILLLLSSTRYSSRIEAALGSIRVGCGVDHPARNGPGRRTMPAGPGRRWADLPRVAGVLSGGDVPEVPGLSGAHLQVPGEEARHEARAPEDPEVVRRP